MKSVKKSLAKFYDSDKGLKNWKQESRLFVKPLLPGAELFEIEFTVDALEQNTGGPYDLLTDPAERKVLSDKFKVSWNDIFSAVAPLMIDEASDGTLKRRLNNLITDRNIGRFRKFPQLKGFALSEIAVKDDTFQTIKVQLRALGLITKSQRARSVKDTGTYWVKSCGSIKKKRLPQSQSNS